MSGEQHRLVRVAEIMGTVFSAHLVTTDDSLEAAFDAAAASSFAELREQDRVFSPFRPDSIISQLRDGGLFPANEPLEVAAVRIVCERIEVETGGRFSAFRNGWFDPTGYVKGWATEQAYFRALHPLLETPGVIAVGINAGGDMQLGTAPGADWTWRVGVADPREPSRIIARLEVRDGAVATSGTAERGAHIMDPRTGATADDVLSATVLASSLTDADVLATAAVVAGIDELSWISSAAHTSGVLLGCAGRVRRWAGGVEIGDAGDTLISSAAHR